MTEAELTRLSLRGRLLYVAYTQLEGYDKRLKAWPELNGEVRNKFIEAVASAEGVYIPPEAAKSYELTLSDL